MEGYLDDDPAAVALPHGPTASSSSWSSSSTSPSASGAEQLGESSSRGSNNRSKMWLSFSALSLDKELGRGAFAQVFRGTYMGTTQVAVKIDQVGNSTSSEEPTYDPENGAVLKPLSAQFLREVRILKRISRHPNIVTFLGYTHEVGHPDSLVFEFLEMGSLGKLLQNPAVRFEPQHRDFALQAVARALAFLHGQENPLIHNDVKADNILIGKNWSSVKLTDFGVSRMRQPIQSRDDGEDSPAATTAASSAQYFTTIEYRAPEVILARSTDAETPAVDVYSYGLLASHCLCSKPPFHWIQSRKELEASIVRGDRPELPLHTPSWLKALVQRCWSPIPDARPSMAEIVGTFTAQQGDLISSALATSQSNTGYTTKAVNNLYARIYHGVLKPANHGDSLKQMAGSARLVEGVKGFVGSWLLFRQESYSYFGLLLYRDEQGLRESEEISVRNLALGQAIAQCSASPLFRRVLESAPVQIIDEDSGPSPNPFAIRRGAQACLLTRLQLASASILELPILMQKAIEIFAMRMVPRLAAASGFRGAFPLTNYNRATIWVFMFFDTKTSLSEFEQAGVIPDLIQMLVGFELDDPMTFEAFSVVDQFNPS